MTANENWVSTNGKDSRVPALKLVTSGIPDANKHWAEILYMVFGPQGYGAKGTNDVSAVVTIGHEKRKITARITATEDSFTVSGLCMLTAED